MLRFRPLLIGALTMVSAAACSPESDPSLSAEGGGQALVTLDAANLTSNPSFESGIAGWTSWQGSLARTTRSDAPHGGAVVKVSRTSGSAFSVDDAPDTVSSAVAGTRYVARVSVAAASKASIGRPVQLVIRERASGSLAYVKEWTATTTLASTFKELSVEATVVNSGDVIDVYVLQLQAGKNHAFFADALTLAPVRGAVSLPADNRTVNPSFETDAAGWASWQGVVTRVAHANAPHGSQVARVDHATGTAYSIDDSPSTIAAAAQGSVYSASAHVAAATAGAVGKGVKLVIRERDAATRALVRTTASPTVSLTSGFQALAVTSTVSVEGNVIDVYVQQSAAAPGDAFFVDALTLSGPPASTGGGEEPEDPGTPEEPVSNGKPAGGVQFHCVWDFYTNAERIAVLDKLKAANLQWVRIDMAWAGIEATYKGERAAWYTSRVDFCVDEASKRGLKVLLTLWRTPGWANGYKDFSAPPNNPQDYADFARWAAARWAGKVQAWEVWNEPDPVQTFWTGTVPQYAAMLKAAYPAFKQGDPSTTVVLGGPTYNNDGWISQVYAELGGATAFDVVATHPYQGQGDAEPERPSDGNDWWFTSLPKVVDVMKANGDGDKPIWFTEFGWSAHANWSGISAWQRGVTEAQQADFARRAFEYARLHYPNVKAMFWYKERVRPGESDVHQAGYGLLREDLSPRPAYTTLQNYFATP